MGDTNGNINPACSFVAPMQIAMDNDAKRALISIETKHHFATLSADVLENVAPIYYCDLRAAPFMVLGLY